MFWSVLAWGFIPIFGFDLLFRIIGWFTWKPDEELSIAGGPVVRRNRRSKSLIERDLQRHPLRSWSTWAELAILLFCVLGPELMFAGTASKAPVPTYQDRREELLEIRKECPALAADANGLLVRGVPTPEQVSSLRARQEVVSSNPVKGQKCASWQGLHPFKGMKLKDLW